MTFVPENRLEEAMLQAASHEPARPQFYHLLMESELFVLGERGTPEADTPLPDGTISLDTVVNEGTTYHPVFTSAARMKTFSDKPYFCMQGRALFLGTRGASFVINPGSDPCKTMVPDEIGHWLAQAEKTTPSVSVSVGRPKVLPRRLMKALCVLFMSRSRIVAAHLAYVSRDGTGEEPHPLIGLITEADEGDMPRLAQEIFEVAATALPGVRIDVVHIEPQGTVDPLKKHVLSIAPFYRRGPGIPLN